MAEEKDPKVVTPEADPEAEKDPDLEQGAGGQPKPVPYQRFKEVREQAKALEAQLAEQAKKLDELAAAEAKRQQEQAAKEEDDLAKKQEFEQLATKRAEERDAAKATAAQLEGDLKRYQDTVGIYLAEARKSIPEHLLPLLDKLDPLEQLQYISENQQQLGAKPVTGVPVTNGSKTPNATTVAAEEKRKQAATTARF